jgi:hypothetical protein
VVTDSFICHRCGEFRSVGVSHIGSCQPRSSLMTRARRVEQFFRDLSAWLDSPHGRFELYYAARSRN